MKQHHIHQHFFTSSAPKPPQLQPPPHFHRLHHQRVSLSVTACQATPGKPEECGPSQTSTSAGAKRRQILIAPLLTLGFSVIQSSISRADDAIPQTPPSPSPPGSVVDFFTVWLPAPTLSFLSYADEMNPTDNIGVLKGLLGSIPDNAFQKNLAGKDWNLSHRVASVLVGGLKLSGVGFISSIAAVASSNALNSVRTLISPEPVKPQRIKRSPILKTAVVYASFLGISANLRYQIIAGLVEHRISDELSAQPVLVAMLSFVVRTINSYLGTQQWIDLARFSGLQSRNSEPASYEAVVEPPLDLIVECKTTEEASTDVEIKNQ
ncbi:Protein RETICULATA-RELATED 6, chloroplastic [Linum perenne]